MVSKKAIVLEFVLLLLFFGVLGQNVSFILVDKLSEFNTVEMFATVSDVESTSAGGKNTWTIDVKQPNGKLLISSVVEKNLDLSAIGGLQEGEQITFRMTISTASQFRETGTGNIVALSSPTQEIFSIDRYNEVMGHEILPIKIVGIVVQVILLFLLIYFGRKIKISRKN